MQYFQSLYGLTKTYELKGIKIVNNVIPVGNKQKADINNTPELQKCVKISFAICLYSLCYSIHFTLQLLDRKSNVLHAIVHSASQFRFTSNLPESVEICGSSIKVQCNKQSKEVFNNSIESKEIIKTLISNNHMQNSGFLMSALTSCIVCINQVHLKQKHLFSLLSCSNSDSSAIKHTKNINGINTLVETISNIFIQNTQAETIEYHIQFIKCSSTIIENERKKYNEKT